MSYRKKRLLLIQILLFTTAILLMYIFYYQGTSNDKEVEKVELKNEELTGDNSANFFEDVEYRGLDANGNRYLLESEVASFNDDKPGIDMIGMNATFTSRMEKHLKFLEIKGNIIIRQMICCSEIMLSYYKQIMKYLLIIWTILI